MAARTGLTGETLVKYARAQGVAMVATEAWSEYKHWASKHPADARIFESAHRLQYRDPAGRDRDRCAWPACRDAGDEVRFLRGSSPLTATHDAAFCEQHAREFYRALRIMRGHEVD